jgi:outer membrane protein OmpA-like peptidoglycan-associated protein
MYAALAAFAVGATAGIFLVMRHFLRKRLPVSVALLHGLGGATGFALVLFVVVREPSFRPTRDALYLFIGAIALGCVNLLFHVRRVRHRTSLIVMHALTAVSGVGTLVYALITHESQPTPALQAPPPAETKRSGDVVAMVPPPAPNPAAPAPTEPARPAEPPAAEGAHATETAEPTVDPALRSALARPIHFGAKSVQLDGPSLAAVREVASLLKTHPEVTEVEVQGYADERGAEERNLALTRQRASIVVQALASSGVAATRLRAAGYGSRCPSDAACMKNDAPPSCHTSEAWDQDRRVVLVPLRVGSVALRGALVCDQAVGLIPTQDRAYHAENSD